MTFLVFYISKLQITDKEAFMLGGIWILLTISFEFLAGHMLFGATGFPHEREPGINIPMNLLIIGIFMILIVAAIIIVKHNKS